MYEILSMLLARRTKNCFAKIWQYAGSLRLAVSSDYKWHSMKQYQFATPATSIFRRHFYIARWYSANVIRYRASLTNNWHWWFIGICDGLLYWLKLFYYISWSAATDYRRQWSASFWADDEALSPNCLLNNELCIKMKTSTFCRWYHQPAGILW